MKRHNVFKKKLDAIHGNILGIVYVFDQPKCWRKDYCGIVRVIWESYKMIRQKPQYLDLCAFEWRQRVEPFVSYCMYNENQNLIQIQYENINQVLNMMKRFFPQYPAGVPSKFVNNYTREFRALTHLVVEEADINEAFNRFFEPVHHPEGLVLRVGRTDHYGKVFKIPDASRDAVVRSGD
jgi:hypothetical protein